MISLYLNSNLTLSILLSPVNLSGFQSIVWGIHTYIHVVTNVHTLLARTLPRGFSGFPIMHGGRVEGEGKHPIKGMGR